MKVLRMLLILPLKSTQTRQPCSRIFSTAGTTGSRNISPSTSISRTM